MSDTQTNSASVSIHDYVRLPRLRRVVIPLVVLVVFASEPVLAESMATSFCQSPLVLTVKNLFTLIQYGGPLVGGVVALGATVARPMIQRADKKGEILEMRNQAVIWGVIVAPLGTVILQFLMDHVVVGGTSCGF